MAHLESDEVPLLGGDVTAGVVRVGGTVRRPWQDHTPAVHALLEHLVRAGFDGAPRPLGRDTAGREILTYVEGDVPPRPLPGWAATDEVLHDVGRLLQRYHHAIVDFVAPAGARWNTSPALPPGVPPVPGPPELIGHGDLTPDNVVFRDGRPFAMIDFDLAGPMTRLLDLATVARHWAPLTAPEDRPASLRAVDVGARMRVLCDGYGLAADQRAMFVDEAIGRSIRSWHFMRSRALAEPGGGWERMWSEGAGERINRATAWLTANGPALERHLV